MAKGRRVTRGERGEGATHDEGRARQRGDAMRATTMRQCDAARAKGTCDDGGRVAKGDAWPWGDATEATRGEGRGRAEGVMYMC